MTESGSVEVAALRHAAARVWRNRHRFELQAAARFERLAQQLHEQEASAALVDMASSAAQDERRHAELCAELVTHFGGDAPQSTPIAAPSCAPGGLCPRSETAYEMVAMSCITETLSCALLGELLEQARDPKVKSVMHEICRDEVRHGRLGWAYLEAEKEARGLPTVMLAEHLPAMLNGTVNDEVFVERPSSALERQVSGLGALERQQRVAVFEQVMTHVVFPGLRRYGVDTGSADRWLRGRLGRGTQ